MTALLGEFRQVFLPYCLLRQADGSYVVCNRRYKPLGLTLTDHVIYEAHPVRVRFKGLTPKRAAKISYRGSEDLDRIYLYNDGCIPTDSAADWAAYSERLRLLAKLKVERTEG